MDYSLEILGSDLDAATRYLKENRRLGEVAGYGGIIDDILAGRGGWKASTTHHIAKMLFRLKNWQREKPALFRNFFS